MEMQQMPKIEKNDCLIENCLKWTIYSGKRKVIIKPIVTS